MRHAMTITLWCCLCGSLWSADDAGKATPAQRLLKGDDASKANALQRKAEALIQQDKFAEGQAVFTELIALRARLQGDEHWQMQDARRTAKQYERLAALTPEARAEYRSGKLLAQQGVALSTKGRYAEAAERAQKALELLRRHVGEE